MKGTSNTQNRPNKKHAALIAIIATLSGIVLSWLFFYFIFLPSLLSPYERASKFYESLAEELQKVGQERQNCRNENDLCERELQSCEKTKEYLLQLNRASEYDNEFLGSDQHYEPWRWSDEDILYMTEHVVDISPDELIWEDGTRIIDYL